MFRSLALFTALGAAVLVAAPQEAAARPTLTRARLTTIQAGQGPTAGLEDLAGRTRETTWLAYAMPMVDRYHFVCCWDGGDHPRRRGACRLAGDQGFSTFGSDRDHDVPRDSALSVLLRVRDGEVDDIRAYSESCPVEAEGLPVTWVEGVPAGASVAFLQGLASGGEDGPGGGWEADDRALFVLALHDDPAADVALSDLVAAPNPRKMRKKAAFWLGQARGEKGYSTLVRELRAEPDGAMRKDFVFPVSQSDVPEVSAFLAEVATGDDSSAVRKEALFWLAQRGGGQALSTLETALANDPDPAVRKHALFALTQIPDGAGTPALARAAADSDSREVRKEALFWLAQEGGDEALQTLTRALRSDPDPAVRKHALFAATQLPDRAGIPLLVETASSGETPEVRKEALFWLAQQGGDVALRALDRALEDDPDTSVRKQVLFALTQIPDGAGIPRLLEAARSQADPELRKQALFWLIQSDHPQAEAVLDRVLDN